MHPSIPPPDETQRLAALRRYAVLDTPSEQALDDLAALAAQICETPIALVSLVDEQRQWFKARVGLKIEETPRDISFCAYALQQTELFIVPDATQDTRFADNPLVIGESAIRFYAGAPLVTADGAVLGTLCVKDHVPRTLTPAQEQALRVLSRQVMTHLELRRQGHELAESEARTRLLIKSSNIGLWDWDLVTNQVFFSPEWKSQLGLADDAVLGGSEEWESRLHPDDRDAAVARVQEYLTGRRMEYESEFRLRHQDGSWRWILARGVFLRDAAGQPVRIMGLHLDLTERKQAEEALQISEARFAAVFQSNPAAIGITDPQTGRIIDVNEQMCAFLGWRREEMKGQTTIALKIWADLKQRTRMIERVSTHGSARDTEVQLCRRDGKVCDVLMALELVEMPGEAQPVVITMFIDLTARKQAEEEMRRSTDLLQAVAIWTEDAVFVKDREGRYLLFNPAAEGFVGRPAAEVLGRDDTQVFEPSSARVIQDTDRKVMETGLTRTTEEVLQVAGGEKTFMVTKSPYRDREGRIIGLIGISRDITERKRAEEELRISEGRYRALFEHAPDGIMIPDPQAYYLDANPSMCRMLGYTREELIGKHARDIVPPAEFEHIKPTLDEIQATSTHHREWQFRRKDGSIFPAEVSVTTLPDGNLLAMIRDVTERKRIEGRLRRLIESNVQGIFFWNMKGEISDANEAFLNLSGYQREDLQAGRVNWVTMTPPEYRELDRRAVEELTTRGVCAAYEKEYLRADGTRVPVLLGAATFEDGPEEGVCFVLDLTERKKLEQQMLRSQRMESIGTLAGGMAHDLNNVLGPIIMSLSLLKMRLPDAASQELLSIISGSARHGADLVRQVLSFARGVEGRRVEVPIQQVIGDVVKIVDDTFLKSIKARTNLPPDLWTVIGDPTQLHQVLLNLCLNARDAMPDGGLLFIAAENVVLNAADLASEKEAKPGPHVSLKVSDGGTGMTPDLLARIFDPFFTTKETGKGTGLGLSTTMAIVKSHGGFIQVVSEIGKGTTFTVYLPAQAETAPAAEVEPVSERPRGRGELVLVVDDEASVRRVTQHALEAFGYRVVLASDGVEAVALYAERREEIAVVLTDMMMPVMDGPTAIRALLKINPAVRIIGASGLPDTSYVTKAAQLGVRIFLPKPFTTETLLQALRQLLVDQSAPRA